MVELYTLLREFQAHSLSSPLFTVRAVCSLLCLYRLIRPGNEPIIPYAIRIERAVAASSVNKFTLGELHAVNTSPLKASLADVVTWPYVLDCRDLPTIPTQHAIYLTYLAVHIRAASQGVSLS
jgi:hypothetical protein